MSDIALMMLYIQTAAKPSNQNRKLKKYLIFITFATEQFQLIGPLKTS